MRRRSFLGALGAATIATAGCTAYTDGDPNDGRQTTSSPDDPTTTPPNGLSNGSFEEGLTRWTVDQDMPDQVGPDGADSGTTTDRAADGDTALTLTLDGSHDDGTVWVQQEVDLTNVDTLAVDAYSPEPSFNEVTQLAAYTGPTAQLEETDFDRSEQVRDHEGWKTYKYAVDHDGAGLVAVGISIVWETTATRFLDNIRLRED
jgi:hypothetical protein